jgi:cytochrome b pre-mRNA-processing protein 3
MSIASLFRRTPHRREAHAAYTQIVARARAPEFFTELEAPDTLDGRFEVIALHAFLVLNRLRADHEATSEFAQSLFDAMFADLDRGLREMGATDLGVGRQVKEMAKGFYGRIVAYEQGLDGDDEALAEALRRNLYGTVTPRPESVAQLGRYMRRQAAVLSAEPIETFFKGEVNFAPLFIEND